MTGRIRDRTCTSMYGQSIDESDSLFRFPPIASPRRDCVTTQSCMTMVQKSRIQEIANGKNQYSRYRIQMRGTRRRCYEENVESVKSAQPRVLQSRGRRERGRYRDLAIATRDNWIFRRRPSRLGRALPGTALVLELEVLNQRSCQSLSASMPSRFDAH